ncbi:hypothetical protein NA57DRAFT_51178 [Rhizodiscina lignyota]|uniref:Uncharacterized protein n=1 Tax=Rhizodiscina lignyota TaxID=1504668 RepID=A0A9P4IMN8_9PEZI|nr:hypothetical protein NA57DRAFT_51178 [Rhizodiscina lignyota]
MTTVSLPLPSLEVTAAADDMEISSEPGRFDDDIDIDFDLTVDRSDNADGDYMLEDTRSETGKAPSIHDQEMNQENIMYDEQENFIGNSTMEDDTTALLDEHLTDASFEAPVDTTIQDAKDEDLIDYDDDDDDDDFGNPAKEEEVHAKEPDTGTQEFQNKSTEDATQSQYSLSNEQVETVEGVYVRDFSAAEEAVQDSGYVDGSEAVHHGEGPVDNNISAADGLSHPTTQSAEEDPTDDAQSRVDHGNAQDLLGAHHSVNDTDDPSDSHNQTDLPVHDNQDQDEQQPEDYPDDENAYHSVIVLYEGAEISLFPPREHDESETYFLGDASLASRSIGDLLNACREVLGDTISEEQELQLEIRDLDLTIGEESAHALSTSFSELLEVYLSLHSLDGTDQPHPLYVDLVTKTKFSARLSSLRGAIAEGRGMSQIWKNDEGDGPYTDDQANPTGDDEYQEAAAQVTDSHTDPPSHVDENANGTDANRQSLEHAVGSSVKPEVSQAAIVEDDKDGDRVELPVEEPQHAYDEIAEHRSPNNGTEGGQTEPLRDGNEAASNYDQSVQNASTGPTHTGDQDIHGHANDHQLDEDLFDFEDIDEREDNSTGSSTVVGDGSAGQEDGKVQGTSTEENIESTHGAENSLVDEGNLNYDNGADLEYEEDFPEHDSEALVEQNTISAELDGDTQDIGATEGGDNLYLHGTDNVATGDQINDAAGIDPDVIDWEDDVADDNPLDHQPNTGAAVAPEGEVDEQDELWDDLLESDQQEVDHLANDEANEPTISVQPDFAASTETLVAGIDNHEQPETARATELDDFDEITYDEEEEETSAPGQDTHDDETHTAPGQPNDSPSGKRSYTEYLEGDLEDGELDPKHHRST